MNKKAMETWVLVFIILAIVFLVVMVAWYGGLGRQLGSLFDKLLGWF